MSGEYKFKFSWHHAALGIYLFVLLFGVFVVLVLNGASFRREEASDKYCYAFFTPHGGFWQDVCYETRTECNRDLRSDRKFRTVNTAHCYVYETTDAYCLDGVSTGRFRYDDADGTKIPEYATICTREFSACDAMRQYLGAGHRDNRCYLSVVPTRESEIPYLTPRSRIREIQDAASRDKKL